MAKVTRAEVDFAISEAVANPDQTQLLASAVRLSLDWLAQENPGNAVELRVPPYRVVQLIEGINHRRGTPPAVVEIDPATWIQILSKKIEWQTCVSQGKIIASGEQSDLTKLIEGF